MVIQYRRIIGTPAEGFVNGLISGFSCMDCDVERFLKAKALQHEQRNRSRTYLVISGHKLAAYFTLSLKAEVKPGRWKRFLAFGKAFDVGEKFVS